MTMKDRMSSGVSVSLGFVDGMYDRSPTTGLGSAIEWGKRQHHSKYCMTEPFQHHTKEFDPFCCPKATKTNQSFSLIESGDPNEFIQCIVQDVPFI